MFAAKNKSFPPVGIELKNKNVSFVTQLPSMSREKLDCVILLISFPHAEFEKKYRGLGSS